MSGKSVYPINLNKAYTLTLHHDNMENSFYIMARYELIPNLWGFQPRNEIKWFDALFQLLERIYLEW